MNLDRLLDNRTPLVARCFAIDDAKGRDVVVTVAKLTFEVSASGDVRLAWPTVPIRITDEHRKGPRGSLKTPSDVAPEKPGTDVLLTGKAHPLANTQAVFRDVTLRIGEGARYFEKRLRAHGPRVFYDALHGIVPGPAAPLKEPCPMTYELAYGGTDYSDLRDIRVSPDNPSGLGVSRDPPSLRHAPAPRWQYPDGPFDRPAGFGPIARDWEPRRARAGTYDERWQRERAPLFPEDFNPRFFSVAPDDQWLEEPLRGDEIVSVEGATPEGRWLFRLPRFQPSFTAVVRGKDFPLDTHLDTLFLDSELRLVELVWRATVPVPRVAAALESVRLEGVLPRDLVLDWVARVEQTRRAVEAS